MVVDVAAISSEYVREKENFPRVPASIETLEVSHRGGLAVDKEIFEEYIPLMDAGNRRVVQMEVKVVGVEALPK